MSRFRDWDSDFYDNVFANPPEDPLLGLEDVTSKKNNIMGKRAVLRAANSTSLKASCEAIVKLSREGSTYYSSIRGTSSATGSAYQFPPQQTSRDKVSRWVTDYQGDSEPATPPNACVTTVTPPNACVTTVTPPNACVTTVTPPNARVTTVTPPNACVTTVTPPNARVTTVTTPPPPSTSQPVVPRRPLSPGHVTSSQPITEQYGGHVSQPITVQYGGHVSPPRQPHIPPVLASHRDPYYCAYDPDDHIVKGLQNYTVEQHKIKILIRNVPDTPHIKSEMNRMLLQHVDKVYEIQHLEHEIIAITDKQGSLQFRDAFHRTLLDCNSGVPLQVFLVT